ncbi:MAG: hypothetical protein H6684_01675 [Deltaproteobacteria bacterium]|nr:hypothetical protein [Deltaproteobacteria bacterium]MCB9487422.1 hypothetical protein [Deltaproteobacteria bacterium]
MDRWNKWMLVVMAALLAMSLLTAVACGGDDDDDDDDDDSSDDDSDDDDSDDDDSDDDDDDSSFNERCEATIKDCIPFGEYSATFCQLDPATVTDCGRTATEAFLDCMEAECSLSGIIGCANTWTTDVSDCT